jgi:large subunit ribosomal protein L2
MGLKKFKPVTAGTRLRIGNTYEELTSDTPEKSLLAPYKGSGGRNNLGHRSMRHIGGGHKRRFRIIDFKRDKDGVPAIVKTIEYDPNRTAFIALVQYKDGDKRYILAPQGLEVGKRLMSGEKATPEIGNTMFLKDIPFGQEVHNIELHPGQGGALARSAGSHAILDARDGKYAILKMPSGETRMILSACKATIGKVSNPDHNLESLGKAGRSRWIGRRPRTRAVAMNPVDHPMGGGEGKASGGHPRSRKGLYAKGLKTRKRKKLSNKFIVSRRKKK